MSEITSEMCFFISNIVKINSSCEYARVVRETRACSCQQMTGDE